MEIDFSQPPTFEEHCQYILGIICAWESRADDWHRLDFSYIGRRCRWRYPNWYQALKYLIRTGWVRVRPDGNIVAVR